MSTDKQKSLAALKICRGQIDGIIRMIEENRYCIDISNQIMASQAVLKRANKLIITQHMNHCVKSAMNDPEQTDDKINEIIDLLDKIL